MATKSSKKGKKSSKKKSSSKKGGGQILAMASASQVQSAKKTLEKRLIFDVAEEAFSASSGTNEYGPENIVGVGASHKIRGDVLTNEPCVTVYVVAKVDKDKVAASARIPESVNGVQTDVVATGELHALPYKGRYRPAPGGVSVGHFKITAGTLGCLAKKGASLCILSNNHVLANSNNAAIGDPILQPGPIDGGTNPADLIAKLLQFVPIKFGGPINKVDAAIGKVTASNKVTPLVRCYGKIKLPAVPCAVNMLVKKCGRTTQFTRGRITDCTATVKVNYGVGIAVFQNQIIIQSLNPPAPFSQGGDSGSLIVTDQTSQPVGLLFAGSATHTIANRISDVTSALGITIFP